MTKGPSPNDATDDNCRSSGGTVDERISTNRVILPRHIWLAAGMGGRRGGWIEWEANPDYRNPAGCASRVAFPLANHKIIIEHKTKPLWSIIPPSRIILIVVVTNDAMNDAQAFLFLPFELDRTGSLPRMSIGHNLPSIISAPHKLTGS